MDRRRFLLTSLAGALPRRSPPRRSRRWGRSTGLVFCNPAFDHPAWVGAFLQGMRELGYIEGQNLVLEPRIAANRPSDGALRAVRHSLVSLEST